jgi:hypothetical protein
MFASCRPAFPRELFTITGQGADFPIMLSRGPAGTAGRKVEASSGTRRLLQNSGRVSYDERAESEMSASAKLNAQVLRADRWLQIDHLELFARDFTTYGTTSTFRKLTIEGTAFR